MHKLVLALVGLALLFTTAASVSLSLSFPLLPFPFSLLWCYFPIIQTHTSLGFLLFPLLASFLGKQKSLSHSLKLGLRFSPNGGGRKEGRERGRKETLPFLFLFFLLSRFRSKAGHSAPCRLRGRSGWCRPCRQGGRDGGRS